MASSRLRYRVRAMNPHAHLFHVTLTIARPIVLQRVSLPVWIPGSYLVREFSKNLQQLEARQSFKPVALTQLDKCSWQVQCVANQALVLTYQIYAFDNSVRTAWLDANRGFFNGTSVFLRVSGQEESQHELTLLADQAMSGWQLAIGLSAKKAGKNGFGTYIAANYDELVDSPVEMGKFWSGSFQAGAVPHRFVVAGAPPGFDGERLLVDAKAICDAEISFWHGHPTRARAIAKVPHQSYLFMLNAVNDGYGGLEHRNSTALICKRHDLPRLSRPIHEFSLNEKDQQSEGYTRLLGLISHEYFHTWNVKRLRPSEFASYDYTQENYTRLLWFFEGFTSYYDDLLLRRAGLIDDAAYLKLLGKTINQVRQTPGRAIQSAAQASMDAWIKYYRQDENTPNATVSYYSKGALVALCLDLSLRQEEHTTLDAVMRALWLRCQGGPMSEGDLMAVLADLTGRSFDEQLASWVHTTMELPLQSLLERQGVVVHQEPAQLAQRLGLSVTENAGIQIKTVLSGGATELAGFASADEWIGVKVGSGKLATQWRLNKLDELLLYADGASEMVAIVARDKRLIELSLTLPEQVTVWRLSTGDSKLVGQWLSAA